MDASLKQKSYQIIQYQSTIKISCKETDLVLQTILHAFWNFLVYFCWNLILIWQIINKNIITMADEHRNSQIEGKNSRTKSLLGSVKGSFKMAQSLLVPGSNKKVVNLQLPGVRIIDKDQYKKQQVCQVCYYGFSKLTRQHHCRVCANAVCSACSASSINKERCCDICAYKYSNTERETTKSNILFELQGAAILIVQSRNALEQELKKINEATADLENTEKIVEISQRKLIQLQKNIQELRKTKEKYEKQIQSIQE